MRILWAIFGIKMYALWYLHPSAKTKKTKAAALPMLPKMADYPHTGKLPLIKNHWSRIRLK